QRMGQLGPVVPMISKEPQEVRKRHWAGLIEVSPAERSVAIAATTGGEKAKADQRIQELPESFAIRAAPFGDLACAPVAPADDTKDAQVIGGEERLRFAVGIR